MSMMVSFVLSFFPRDVLDEILNLIESVSEDFLTTLVLYLQYCMNLDHTTAPNGLCLLQMKTFCIISSEDRTDAVIKKLQ